MARLGLIIEVDDKGTAKVRQFKAETEAAGRTQKEWPAWTAPGTEALKKHGKEVDTLTKLYKEQAKENRVQNFLFREGAGQAIALSNSFVGSGGLVQGLNSAYGAYQQLDFAIASGNALASKASPTIASLVGTLSSMATPLSAVVGLTVGFYTAMFQLWQQTKEMESKILDLNVATGKMDIAEKVAQLNREIENLKNSKGEVFDFLIQFAALTLAVGGVVDAGVETFLKWQEARKQLAKTSKEADLAKIEEDQQNKIRSLQSAAYVTTLNSIKSLNLAHEQSALGRIEIERKNATSVLREQAKVASATEKDAKMRGEIEEKLQKDLESSNQEFTAKKIAELQRVTDEVRKTDINTYVSARQIELETQLAFVHNAAERIELTRQNALDRIAVRRRELEEDKKIDDETRASRLLALGVEEIGVTKTAGTATLLEAERVANSLNAIHAATAKTDIDLQLQVMTAYETSVAQQITLAEEAAQKKSFIDEALAVEAARQANQSGAEITAIHEDFEKQREKIAVEAALKQRKLIADVWSEYAATVSKTLADTLKLLIGFGEEQELIDIDSMSRRNELADIDSQKQRDRLAEEFANGEISQREYNLRIADLNAEAVKRQKELNDANLKNNRSSASNLAKLWNNAWSSIVDIAFSALASLLQKQIENAIAEAVLNTASQTAKTTEVGVQEGLRTAAVVASQTAQTTAVTAAIGIQLAAATAAIATITAEVAIAMASIAAASATAATLVSIATFGGAAATGTAAVLAAIATIQAAAMIPHFAQGGSFVVPPGFENDTFPMLVSSREHVQVTPENQVRRQSSGTTMYFNFGHGWDEEQVIQAITRRMKQMGVTDINAIVRNKNRAYRI